MPEAQRQTMSLFYRLLLKAGPEISSPVTSLKIFTGERGYLRARRSLKAFRGSAFKTLLTLMHTFSTDNKAT